MDKSVVTLTGEEIIAIIKAGKEAKASNVEYYGLKISYTSQDTAISGYIPSMLPGQADSTTDTPAEDNLHDRELEEALLAVSDPVAYERLQILGELSDEKA
jgi:hypothetical protein